VRESFALKFQKPIYEGYGATETTPVASCNLPDNLRTDDWRVQTGNKSGTVGMPLPGTSFRIVDPVSLETLPTGEDGLILIGGVQVNFGGNYTSESNARFDQWLKNRDPHSGIRHFEELDALARSHGLSFVEDIPMPVNNRTLVWRRD
jgi:acyl-CoA synthetase (AMP-forming)/AMP-acid ligase II